MQWKWEKPEISKEMMKDFFRDGTCGYLKRSSVFKHFEGAESGLVPGIVTEPCGRRLPRLQCLREFISCDVAPDLAPDLLSAVTGMTRPEGGHTETLGGAAFCVSSKLSSEPTVGRG